MPKVLIVSGNQQYSHMFTERGWEITEDISEADLIQFTGGEDVTPSLYGEPVHPTTFYSHSRDAREMAIFDAAVLYGVPMAGICRGGQFLNVASGGALYQHVSNHAVGLGHKAFDTKEGREVHVSSTHHQMFKPSRDAELIAYAREGGFRESMGTGKIVRETGEHKDAEVVYYMHTNSLCFQPHPEFPGFEECRDYYFELLKEKLGCAA